ncbi:MAG: chromosomal replication initiator protein DnaA [Verrucomicrobiales bacterium]
MNEEQDATAWEQIIDLLREYLGAETTTRWFHHALMLESEEGGGVIGVQSEMHKLWIEMNLLDELRAAFTRVLGLAAEPRIIVIEEMSGEERPAARASSTAESKEVKVVKPVRPEVPESASAEEEQLSLERRLKKMGMNPELNFASFVVGENSQFAHAACRAVAEGMVKSYNPLFIHGRPGLGKTHLMCALGQEMIRHQPKAKVVYSTAENFTNEFIDAVRAGSLEAFRKKYRTVDVMLLDDVQFLSGKEKSQEEFFHTFNALLNSQTQIVLTSDRPAPEIQTFEARLVSRFESGLTVELQPPGFETRVAILRRKMEQWKVELDDAIVFHIANLVKSNVRRLEGALTRVASFAFLSSKPLALENVDEILKDLINDEAQQTTVTVDAIQKTVAEFYDIRVADMMSRRRPARIAFPRQIAMYLTRELTKMSLMEIGEAFGRRDHGTVIHACKRIKAEMEKDAKTAAEISKLISQLRH